MRSRAGFIVISSIFAGLTALMLMSGAGCSPTAPVAKIDSSPDTIQLWQNGPKLRGANIYQRRVYTSIDGTAFIGPGPLGPPYSQSDFNALAAQGSNYVHISHTGIFTEKPPYQVDPAAQANLDDLIAKAAAAHLYVVIAFRSGPGRGEFDIFEGQNFFPQNLVDNDVWRSQSAQDGWAAMWRYTANRYGAMANVAGYDLMVEPNGASVIYQISDPASFYPVHANSLADWNHMYPALLSAVREIDANKPVLVNAGQYASIDWLNSLQFSDDSNVVYTVHPYIPGEYVEQDPTPSSTYPGSFKVDNVVTAVNKAYLDNRLKTIDTFKAAHPGALVAATEYGVHRWAPGAAQYITDLQSLFDTRGLNRAVWLWESSFAGVQSSDDFNFRHGPTATNHSDVTSALFTAITTDWAKNTLKP